MAIPGTHLASSARASAVAFVERVAGNGRAAAAQMPNEVAAAHAITPNIVPSTGAQIADLNRFLEHGVVWANDMFCFARASVGARHVNEVLGHGLTPVDDAMNAAVAILKAPPGRGWSFHAGIAMKNERGQVMIIDHLTESRPMHLREWADMYGVAPNDTFIVSPFAGTKVKGHMTDAATWKWIEDSLVETWKKPAKWGVDVRGWNR